MDFNEAIIYIRQTHKFGSRLGLESTKELLRRLGDPHNKFRSVHVAGTNGKGSVTSMITTVLHKARYKTGMFISPSLERFTERVQVGLEEISQDDVASLLSIIKGKIDEMIDEGYNHPTEFEIVTALGFMYFAKLKVDIAVVEVGLGGRLDATNVIEPLVSVITSIGFDHMDILGDTLGKIAYEKAGIIKANTPTVVYPQEKEALDTLRTVAGSKYSALYEVSVDQITVKYSHFGRQCFDFQVKDKFFKDLKINLSGRHQLLNAATALAALAVLSEKNINVPDKAVYEGLEHVLWPGRMELLQHNPDVVIDGAHNVPGMKALSCALKEYYEQKRKILVIGILEDKQFDDMLKIICPDCFAVIATRPLSLRALEPDTLAQCANKYCDRVIVEPEIDNAIKTGLDLAGKDDLLIVTGSLYLIGMVRKYFKP